MYNYMVNEMDTWLGMSISEDEDDDSIQYEWEDGNPMYFTDWEETPEYSGEGRQCVYNDGENFDPWWSPVIKWKTTTDCDEKKAFMCKISPQIRTPDYSRWGCPPMNTTSGQGWMNVDRSLSECYWAPAVPTVSWSSAEKICRQHGGHLVSFHSYHQVQLISRHMANMYLHMESMWIGFKESYGAASNPFLRSWTWSDQVGHHTLNYN